MRPKVYAAGTVNTCSVHTAEHAKFQYNLVLQLQVFRTVNIIGEILYDLHHIKKKATDTGNIKFMKEKKRARHDIVQCIAVYIHKRGGPTAVQRERSTIDFGSAASSVGERIRHGHGGHV